MTPPARHQVVYDPTIDPRDRDRPHMDRRRLGPGVSALTLSVNDTQIATQTTSSRGLVSLPWNTTSVADGTHRRRALTSARLRGRYDVRRPRAQRRGDTSMITLGTEPGCRRAWPRQS